MRTMRAQGPSDTRVSGQRKGRRAAGMLRDPVTVFIVDDSAQLADMVAELLADPGQVEIAGIADSVAGAIAEIGRLRPDIVVVDLQLKDGNGFEVAEAITAWTDAAPIEVIFFTNHASPEFVRRAAALNVRHFLDKSRDHGKLIELVQAKVVSRTS
ncbi:MAG: response regulator [Betaproteobacteria bacterium]